MYSNIYLIYIIYVYFVYTLYVQIYTKKILYIFWVHPFYILCAYTYSAHIFLYTRFTCIHTHFIYTCTLIHAPHISFISTALCRPLTRNLYDLFPFCTYIFINHFRISASRFLFYLCGLYVRCIRHTRYSIDTKKIYLNSTLYIVYIVGEEI